jgi:hypothetical protein
MIIIKSIDVSEITKYIEKVETGLKYKYVKELAEKIEQQAFKTAPHYKGNMKKALYSSQTENGYLVVQDMPLNSTRPYHMWMAGYGQYPQLNNNGHIKSGDPNFMKNAGKYGEEIALQLAEKYFR